MTSAFKRVPVEATEEMRAAGSRAFTNVDDIYRAMLAALQGEER